MRIVPAVVALLVGLAAGQAQAAPYGSLVIFGDSLSDSGNNAAFGLFDSSQTVTGNSYVPLNSYSSGVYSNGPVWATRFAAGLGVPLAPSALGGTNFAFGGATNGTPGPGPGGFPFSLRAQTDLYLAATGGVAAADALYVVAGGGNNARAALEAIAAGGNLATIAAATAMDYANDIGTIIDQLQGAGARNFLVWNTPNLGTVPAVRAGGPAVAGAGTALSGTMNAALTARLASENGITLFDLFGFGTAIAASPATFGFVNATDACGAVAGADCGQYVFWDGIHPTAAGHRAIADANLALVTAVPEPQVWLMLIGGFFLIGAQVRTRRVARGAGRA